MSESFGLSVFLAGGPKGFLRWSFDLRAMLRELCYKNLLLTLRYSGLPIMASTYFV